MNIILSKNDCIDIYGKGGHIATATTESTLFTFEHGFIRVEGDKVTAFAYINGKKGPEHCIDLAVISKIKSNI